MKTTLTPRFTDEKLTALLRSSMWCNMSQDTIRFEAKARGFDQWASGNDLDNEQWLRKHLMIIIGLIK